jgi:thiol-disulfide isomerase/thioredoxin
MLRQFTFSLLLSAASAALMAAPRTSLLPLDETGYQKLVRSHAGRVLLVDFWATWCEPCRQEMPAMVKLATTYAARGLRFVTVSADTEGDLPKAEAFLRSQRVPFPAYYKNARDDGAFIDSIDKKWSGALPAVFLYDRQGRMAARFVGESDPRAVEKAIKQLLGKPE